MTTQTATIWELDFYSRPILDENKKKVWEVLIAESPLNVDSDLATLFQYAEFCPNSEVNSIRLAEAMRTAIEKSGVRPDRIRFFRQAMTNMITKACEDVDIPVQLSRRTFALNQLLKRRFTDVYPQQPGYQPGNSPSVVFPITPAQPLPEALAGQLGKWQFATLAAADFGDLGDWEISFGESFPLKALNLPDGTPIPGLIIYTSRAIPMAAWMSGLEISAVKPDPGSPNLVLETGVSDRWTLTPLNNASLQAEAAQFEATKQQAQNVHFLAVQSDPNVEAFAGFWLMQG
jgi:RNA-binding protein Tab2/Atab2